MNGSWLPKNEAERAMADAVERGDSTEFFRIFVAAELHLPQVPEEGVVLREGAEQWAPLTRQLGGTTAVPVFTSVEGMGSAVFVGSYAVTSYPELRDRWVQPGWWLAINPGLPIESHVPVAAVDRLASGELGLVDGQLVPAGAATDPDLVLPDPEHETSLEEYLETLLDSTVVLPAARAVDYPDELLTPGFPWRPAGPADAPTIEVFTTVDGCDAAYPGLPRVRMPFLMLMIAWPDGHALSVNPGGPVRMVWPADQIRLLQQRAIAG